MLEDRDYMRGPDSYNRPRISFTIAILIVNAIAFLAQLISWKTPGGAYFQDTFLALSLPGLKHGYVWQLLSFQFMHANLMHILFNSLAIFFFGRTVEQAIGGGRFLALYFSSGVVGGLVQMLYSLIFSDYGSVVGASAGAAGLIGAFAMMYWEERFTMFIYFFPVNMRGKTLLWGSIAFCIISMFIPSTVANAAHLGGVLMGALFARQIIRGSFAQSSFRSGTPEYATSRPRKKLWGSAAQPNEEVSADDYLKSEVDPILDKISAHGIQSLTTREREILEKARSKMTKR